MKALAPVPDDDEPDLFEGDIADSAAAGQSRAAAVGAEFKHLARQWLLQAGARFIRDHHKVGAYHVEGIIRGANDQNFLVLAHGVVDDGNQAGLKRTDTLKKAGFDAVMIRRLRQLPILLVTSHLPEGGSAAAQLADCAPDIFDVIAINGDLAGYQRLRRYLHEQPFCGQLAAPWRAHPSHWMPELFDGDDQPIPVSISYGAALDSDTGAEEVF